MEEGLKNIQDTIQKVCIEHYICNMMKNLTDAARDIKIENFAKTRTLEKAERSIRNIFVTKKAGFSLQQLKSISASRYWLFIFHLKKHIQRFRHKKWLKNRTYVVSALTRKMIASKIKNGVKAISRKVTKL